MPRIKLCHIEDLNRTDSRGYEVSLNSMNYSLFLVRSDNILRAYHNSCPHNSAPLNWLPDIFLSNDQEFIQCTNHGALFEIDSGHCGPCHGKYLEQIEIEIDNNIIFAVF